MKTVAPFIPAGDVFGAIARTLAAKAAPIAPPRPAMKRPPIVAAPERPA